MKAEYKVTMLFVLTLFTFACENIIEEDITNDIAQTVSPIENETVSSNVVKFQWNVMDGAKKYRVQVFNVNQAVVIDSLVEAKHALTCPLVPGTYKWRVRGENAGYQSTYSFPVTFSVIQSDDLTNQQIILSNPANGFYTNATSLTCTWQDLAPTDSYDFELVNVTSGQTVVYQQSNITNTSINLANAYLTQEAEYQWKVKGVNASSQTPFSTRNFFIDRVAPNQVSNILPANNSTQIINQQIDFTWGSPADSGVIQSAITYTIEFSNTITFATIIRSTNVSVTSTQQTFTAAGDYYWRVKAKDAANNESSYSSAFKFTIN